MEEMVRWFGPCFGAAMVIYWLYRYHSEKTNDQDIMPIFNHIYSKLGISPEEISEHPVLITEPLLNPYINREKIAISLFDDMSVPSLFFASQPILSLFSTSNTSGIILESGEAVSQSCIVYEGYSLPNTFERFDYGGGDVTKYLKLLLKNIILFIILI